MEFTIRARNPGSAWFITKLLVLKVVASIKIVKIFIRVGNAARKSRERRMQVPIVSIVVYPVISYRRNDLLAL